ncbi:Myb-like_DNA-binding domain-containing protein [Hexamita inflata]|uniref:Myb-like DNA-binding domain-containing protein n=1 Tax=Hexamita inflata TaxID=28002 RepID=A0AA86P110_9EUKA|nr:Myb-like DNA-binding domain-containing protein [Hexamita inflata]
MQTRIKWLQTDIDQLVQLVSQQNNSKRIDWDLVSSKMYPPRSRQQCKSFYTNILKKELNVEQTTHHVWTNDETLRMAIEVTKQRLDKKQIHDIYFKHLSQKQVNCQYTNLKNFQQQMIQTLKEIQIDNSKIKELSQTDLIKGVQFVACTITRINSYVQQAVVGVQEQQESKFHYQTSLNPTREEVEASSKLFAGIDMKAVEKIFEKEIEIRQRSK